MAGLSLEERVTALESELEQLKRRHGPEKPEDAVPWWEQIRGQFKDDPDYDEAMRLGREWRESFRPKDDEDA